MTTEERVTQNEQRCKSNTHRIDEIEKRVDDLGELTASVRVLADRESRVESDVKEIKTDVKALTSAPGKKWDTAVMAVITAIVSAIIGYALAHIGL